MKNYKLWLSFIIVIIISFSVLGFFGTEIYRQSPPIPSQVVTDSGKVLFTGQDIKDGQNIWQSIGGQEVGTIWGHGAYVAPDWSADWLHRESLFILNALAKQMYNTNYNALDAEKQAVLIVKMRKIIRTNTYNPDRGTIIVSALRAEAIKSNSDYYAGLFMNNPDMKTTREHYAIPPNSIKDIDRMNKMNAFYFWAAWACGTERPGSDITYTHNWPPDELVANKPTSSIILWTGFSIIMLILGIGLLAWYYAKNNDNKEGDFELPKKDPLFGIAQTPSMKATLKYFWIVSALLLLQVLMGVITAHFGVEGNTFYGINIVSFLPYAVTRTWHVQLAIFWIATTWLATGLYIAPAVSGYEPKFQKLGVNILFLCLLIIVVGSFIGQWLAIMQKLGLIQNFWFGHQGYEYVDLGRFWQTFLFIGLILWLILIVRALLPALKQRAENRQLLVMFLISTVAIALIYGAGLMWGRQTHISVAEYWRWWVVHLWVEGFFEVFATVVVAFLFVRLGLLKVKTATSAILFSTAIFLSGGIIGTFHHLYFTGTPTAVLALGATFSALEVLPLVFMGLEAYRNYKISKSTEWLIAYKLPIYFFISVSFWNFVGAGIFGFLINPPIALYYMQGLNTTPVHAHTALFGVYGMLGIGLMLFVLKGLTNMDTWKDNVLRFSFWLFNIGLLLMVLISLLPVGLAQTIASVEHGIWYARSAEFLQNPTLNTFRWLRLIGDSIFAIGALSLVWFVIGLKTGWSINKEIKENQ
ncbi:MAG: nitric-oxide reductase large subunit [FCB group bacterium]|jgi:nitric oxide reductase subunit B